MSNAECDRIWEVDALREKRLDHADVEAHLRHRAACAVCAERYRADEEIARLGRELLRAEPTPSVFETRRLRAAMLRAAANPEQERRAYVLAAAAAAFVLALAFVLTRSPATAPSILASRVARLPRASIFSSTVEPASDARYSHTRDLGAETVTLEEGTLTIEVRKQRPDERFIVALPDGHIEVRGTRFSVVVRDGRTERVDVTEGVVAFVRGDDAERRLAAGDAWSRPHTAAATPSAHVGTSANVAAPDTSYADAVALYRARRWDEAAQALAAFTATHGSSAEAEDAEYLRANALGKGNHAALALDAAESFLAKHPASFHAKDAALVVVHSARELGQCARARRALEGANAGRDPDVATALSSCR